MPRPKAPAGESQEQKFVRLANIRMNKALKDLDSLMRLSGGGGWNEAQADAIVSALKGKVVRVEKAFSAVEEPAEPEFML